MPALSPGRYPPTSRLPRWRAFTLRRLTTRARRRRPFQVSLLSPDVGRRGRRCRCSPTGNTWPMANTSMSSGKPGSGRLRNTRRNAMIRRPTPGRARRSLHCHLFFLARAIPFFSTGRSTFRADSIPTSMYLRFISLTTSRRIRWSLKPRYLPPRSTMRWRRTRRAAFTITQEDSL
jgi:hypothetical protein